MPESIRDYVAQLNGADLAPQAAAAEALARQGHEAQPAIVALVQVCGSSDDAVRNGCAAALEDVGPPASDQIDDLALLARSANSDVAFWAVTLLGRAAHEAAAAVPILAERLADRSAPTVQRRAAWALGQLGPSAASALVALRIAAEGDDAPLATQAQRALQRIQAA